MRELVARYLSRSISRRGFLKGLTTAGISLASAESILESLVPVAHAQGTRRIAPEAIKMVEGTGAECFAEQLIASGVKYVFGNSASEDAQFYEALVDRPQLKYILTPHEGPGAAMAAGYVKASGEPTIVMQAAVVGLVNAMGQMFNAYKEQTPLVFYSYRTDQTRRAGRDGFDEVLVARAARGNDPGDRPARLQGGMDAALRADLRFLAFGSERREDLRRDHHPGQGRPAHARAPQSSRSRARCKAPRRSEDAPHDRRRRGLWRQGRVQGGGARRAPRHACDPGAADLRELPRVASVVGRRPARGAHRVARFPEKSGRGHKRREQIAAQQPATHRGARSEIYRHAQRQLEHGQRDEHGGAAGRRRRLWPGRPQGRGRRNHDLRAVREGAGARTGSAPLQRESESAARLGVEEPRVGPQPDARRPRHLRGRPVRRPRCHHRP